MGMPRKGSRKITVDGRRFLWRLGGTRRLIDEAPGAVTLTFQEDTENPGRVAQVSAVVKVPKTEDWEALKASIKPRDASLALGACLTHGWDPRERGSAWRYTGPTLDLGDYETVS